MDKEEMLACFDKFDLMKEAVKKVDKNIYIAITFTASSLSCGFEYSACAIKGKRYVKFAFEGFSNTLLLNEKTVNDYREVLEMLEREYENV